MPPPLRFYVQNAHKMVIFAPDFEGMDTGDLGCLLGSNGPISNVILIPQPPQTKKSNPEKIHFCLFFALHRYLYKYCKVNSDKNGKK